MQLVKRERLWQSGRMRAIPVPIRERILELYKRGRSTQEIAQYSGFCVAAVRRVRQQFRQRATLEPRTHLCGRKTLLTEERKQRSRPVNLSITQKFGRVEPKLDVGKSGEATPHDPITRRRITGASEIAAKSGQLGDVKRQRPRNCAIDSAVRNKMIKQLVLRF
jgi:hypothetical protein